MMPKLTYPVRASSPDLIAVRIVPWMMKVEPFKRCIIDAPSDIAIKAVIVEPDERFKGVLSLHGYDYRLYWQAPVQHAMQAWKRLSQLKLGPLTNDVVQNRDLLVQWGQAIDLVSWPITLSQHPLLVARGQIATLHYNAPNGSMNIPYEGSELYVTLYGLQVG